MSARKPNPFEDPVGGFEGRLLLAVGLWIGIHVLAALARHPPEPLSAEAPARVFSAGRAREAIERLGQGLASHPAGSPACDTVRERIERELRLIGYTPQVQETFACGPYVSCGNVRNVVARLPGRGPGGAVLLVAHYDSVGAGPGVADDLSGVATLLEVARVLETDGRLQRPVMFLFTDGEEEGLVGASAFVQSHPRMQEVEVVLNVEARGASGPSLMFETGADNAWLIELYAEHVADPAASSVSVEIYRRMPNDTDYSVFRERGVPGLNFAFIEDVFVYHTSRDDLEALDDASLQHHGENLLAMVYALDGAEVPSGAGSDAVYTDLFGVFVLRLRAGWCWILALGATLAICHGLQRAVRAGELSWRGAAWGVCAWPVLVAAPIVLGVGVVTMLRLATGERSPWHAHPAPTVLALVGCCVVAHAALAPAAARRASPAGLAHGTWLVWGLIGTLLALFVPGASYLFFLPALMIAGATLAMRLRGDLEARLGRVGLCAIVVAAMLWAPVQHGLGAAFGPGASPGLTAPLSILATLLAPLVACASRRLRRSLVGIGSLMLLLGVTLGLMLPHRSVDRPSPMNLVYELDFAPEREQAGAEGAARRRPTRPETRWRVETFGAPLPEAIATQHDFERDEDGTWSARAFPVDIPPPTFEVLEDRELHSGERLVRGVLRSPAFAGRTEVEVIGDRPARSLRAEGIETSTAAGEFQSSASFIDVTPRGIELRILFEAPKSEVAEAAPQETSDAADPAPGPEAGSPAPPAPSGLRIVDTLYGLPLGGEELTEARPASFVPHKDGDVTRVSTRVLFDPEGEGD